MSNQIAVNSIDALKDLRVALALYGEDTLAALGAVGAEIRRTVFWLQQERPWYWQEQIKRRREEVASARAEVFRRQLAKSSSMSEQVENLKRAEASLADAERRLGLTRKWQFQLHHAVLEYQASIRRIKSLAAGDVPSAVNLLTRLIDSLEAYLHTSMGAMSSTLSPTVSTSATNSPPSLAPAPFEAIATRMLDEEPAAEAPPSDQVEEDLGEDRELYGFENVEEES